MTLPVAAHPCGRAGRTQAKTRRMTKPLGEARDRHAGGERDDVIDIAIYIVCGTVLGFLIGLTGVGGGVLTVPILILIVGLNPITAVGTASFYAVLTKLYAVYRHARQDTINWRVGLRFLWAALPGVICASLLVKLGKASLSPEGVDILQNWISYIIIFSIGFSLCTLLVDYNHFESRFLNSLPGKVFSVLCIFLVGAVMGATSIGGGILIIPALLLFYRETSKYVGTSIFVAVLLMFAMSVIYAFLGGGDHSGDVNVKVAAFMAVGSLVGTHQGSALSKRIHPRRLQRIVIAVIILAVLMMLADKLM